LLPEDDELIAGPKELREFLNKSADWSDEDIWQALIEICDERMEHHRTEIAKL